AAVGSEVELVPPLTLRLRRQRLLVGGLAADQVAANGDVSRATLGPECSDHVGCPSAPVEAGDDRTVDLERVQERDRVEGEGRLLAVSERVLRAEASRPVAAQ